MAIVVCVCVHVGSLAVFLAKIEIVIKQQVLTEEDNSVNSSVSVGYDNSDIRDLILLRSQETRCSADVVAFEA